MIYQYKWFIYISIYPLSLHSFIYLTILPSVHLFIHLSIHPLIYPYFYLSILYQSILLFCIYHSLNNLFIYLSIHPSIYSSIYIYINIYLSIYPGIEYEKEYGKKKALIPTFQGLPDLTTFRDLRLDVKLAHIIQPYT